MKRWAVWSALAAAGVASLAYLAPRAHPAARWLVDRDGEQSQARSREISAAFGVDTQGWAGTVTGRSDSHAAYFAEQHPEAAEARRFSPFEAEVALKAPGGAGRILVSLSTSGNVNSWQWTGYPKAGVTDPAVARALAAGALDRLMGKDAAAFRPLADRTPNGETRTFAFERTAPLDERLEATVDSGRLVKAVLTPTYPHDVDEAVSARKKYLDWLQGAVGVGIDFVGVALAACVYIFWAVRRAVRHRWVLAFSATSILWGAVYWSNWMGYDERYESVATNSSFLEDFFGALAVQVCLILMLMALAGAADAIGSQEKLVTLRSVFSASILNRQRRDLYTGGFAVRSAAGGIAAGGIVAARGGLAADRRPGGQPDFRGASRGTGPGRDGGHRAAGSFRLRRRIFGAPCAQEVAGRGAFHGPRSSVAFDYRFAYRDRARRVSAERSAALPGLSPALSADWICWRC